MAQIKIIESWVAEFQATPEYNFSDDDGKPVVIAAVDAHTAYCVKGEIQDGTGRIFEFELPDGYEGKRAKPGVIIHIVCKSLQKVDAPFRVKHVTRTIDVAGK